MQVGPDDDNYSWLRSQPTYPVRFYQDDENYDNGHKSRWIMMSIWSPQCIMLSTHYLLGFLDKKYMNIIYVYIQKVKIARHFLEGKYILNEHSYIYGQQLS